PAQIEQVHALEKHGAVHDAGSDRAELAGRRRHHYLVQLGDTRICIVERDQRLALTQCAERAQVGVPEPHTDLGDASTEFPGTPWITFLERGEALRNQNVARGPALRSVLHE